jgi:hypothetical protein
VAQASQIHNKSLSQFFEEDFCIFLKKNMSVSYAPTKIKVPDGFQTLMEDLTKRILAEQPEDVIGFAATYLHGKILHLKGKNLLHMYYYLK